MDTDPQQPLIDFTRAVKFYKEAVVISDSIKALEITFDGSDYDAFERWLMVMDDVFDLVDQDFSAMKRAAAVSLAGGAFSFFRETRQRVSSWAQLRNAMINR